MDIIIFYLNKDIIFIENCMLSELAQLHISDAFYSMFAILLLFSILILSIIFQALFPRIYRSLKQI